MRLAAIPIGIAAIWSTCQPSIDVVGIALLILSCSECAWGQTGARRRPSRAGPGQSVQAIVAELLCVCCPRDTGRHTHDVVGCVVGWLRLVEQRIAARLSQ